MRVIITGGTGLIGRAMTENLVAVGHEVIILSRSPERADGLPDGVQVEGWDGRTTSGWGHLADGAGAIINLAGANLAGDSFFPSRWTAERKALIRESRANAGQAVVEAVDQAGQKPGVVVQASAVGFYGPHGDEPLTEDNPAGTDFPAKVTSQYWEPSTAPVEDMGVRRVVIRTGPVLSMEGGALPRQLLPFRLFVGGPMGSGKQWYAWIHMADEVAAIRFLMENEEARGAFNLAAPNPLTNAEFAKVVGHVMHRPSFVPVPGFALKLAFGEVAGILLEGQRVVPHRLADLGFEFQFPEAQGALEDLLA